MNAQRLLGSAQATGVETPDGARARRLHSESSRQAWVARSHSDRRLLYAWARSGQIVVQTWWVSLFASPSNSWPLTMNMGLFETIPADYLQFGQGSSFNPKRVPELLGLKKEDVSRLASVSVKSVRYDDAIPEQVRERLEEIANTINLVADAFGGDVEKTVAWFRARNPLLGDVSPKDMIRLGRYERLRKFIINAMLERRGSQRELAGVSLPS